MTFPISRVNQRSLPADWVGDVFTCDIDRTYLATRFSSLRSMARIPLEFAIDKAAIEGMTVLLKEIRRGPDPISRQSPLYFVSASPAQLRPVIERKMLLDGLEFDGTTFKDWVGVIRGRRLRRFREQVGFKLTALLAARCDLPHGARETLIGDDLESDALVFVLYADITAGRLSGDELQRELQRHGVAADDAVSIAQLKQTLPDGPTVRRAYVRLERHTDATHFVAYAPHVVACFGALQMAIGLWQDGAISIDGLARVAAELRRIGHSRALLAQRLGDCVRRAIIDQSQGRQLQQTLLASGDIEELPLPPVELPWVGRQRLEGSGRWTPAADGA